MLIGILSISWLGYATAQMVEFVFIEQIQNDVFINLIIVGFTEFVSALFSKVVLKLFNRR